MRRAELADFDAFATVAEDRSFTRAAAKLGAATVKGSKVKTRRLRHCGHSRSIAVRRSCSQNAAIHRLSWPGKEPPEAAARYLRSRREPKEKCQ
jgi:hypothetical protein